MDNTSVLLIFLCSFMEVADTDPCTDNVPLPNLLRRGESSLGKSPPLCDRYIAEVWYNTGQTEMLTKTPSLGQCGTGYPIWLKDPAPPRDGKEYNLTACIRSILGNCSLEIKVKFKSCGAFNVYYLRSVPSCPSAYCFGTSTRSTDTSKGKILNEYYKQEFNFNKSDTTISSKVVPTDPCTKNVPLPNLLNRGGSSITTSSPLCDRYLAETWYSTGQREMLSKTPSLGRCGTRNPIWQKDPAPPRDGKEYNLTACTRSILGNCSSEIKVKFKSCGTFNVYYLRSVPSCPSAYCFGTSTRSTDTSKGKILNEYYKQEFNFNKSDTTISSKVVPTDPCTKNVPLPNLLNRGGSSITTSSPLCDRYLAETWYSTGQREMLSKTPSLGRCGTRNPIWQKDPAPPRDGKEYNLTACTRSILGNCSSEIKVKFKSCGTFNVYYLRSVPSCPSAYCFDTIDALLEFNITNSHSTDVSKDSAGEETFGYMSWPWLVLIAAVILLVTGITSALISCLVTRRRRGDTSLYNGMGSMANITAVYYQQNVSTGDLQEETYYDAM